VNHTGQKGRKLQSDTEEETEDDYEEEEGEGGADAMMMRRELQDQYHLPQQYQPHPISRSESLRVVIPPAMEYGTSDNDMYMQQQRYIMVPQQPPQKSTKFHHPLAPPPYGQVIPSPTHMMGYPEHPQQEDNYLLYPPQPHYQQWPINYNNAPAAFPTGEPINYTLEETTTPTASSGNKRVKTGEKKGEATQTLETGALHALLLLQQGGSTPTPTSSPSWFNEVGPSEQSSSPLKRKAQMEL